MCVMTDIAAEDVDFRIRMPRRNGPLWNRDPLEELCKEQEARRKRRTQERNPPAEPVHVDQHAGHDAGQVQKPPLRIL